MKRYLVRMPASHYVLVSETNDHEEAKIKAAANGGTIYVRQDHFQPTIDGHIATLKSFLKWYRGHMVDHVDDTNDYIVQEYLIQINFVTHDDQGKPTNETTG